MNVGQTAVEVAREWIGTPWHHQGRIKGVGTDCIGLIVGVAKEIGFDVKDRIVYPRRPNGELEQELKTQLVESSFDKVQAGDILFFRILQEWEHVGIYGKDSVIHVHQTLGRCVEHGLDARWKRRIIGVYTWPDR